MTLTDEQTIQIAIFLEMVEDDVYYDDIHGEEHSYKAWFEKEHIDDAQYAIRGLGLLKAKIQKGDYFEDIIDRLMENFLFGIGPTVVFYGKGKVRIEIFDAFMRRVYYKGTGPTNAEALLMALVKYLEERDG